LFQGLCILLDVHGLSTNFLGGIHASHKTPRLSAGAFFLVSNWEQAKAPWQHSIGYMPPISVKERGLKGVDS
jgi:hypothetical protein